MDEPAFHDVARSTGFRLDEHQAAAAARLAGWPRDRRRSGAYLWGPVGRGKTWLVDRYVDLVPSQRTSRLHFHDFFRELHRAVHRHRGSGHPVAAAMDELAEGLDLLVLDEVHAHDPGDAMLLTRMLRELVTRRTALLATSNYPPRGLLPDPRFHHVLEPGIALLERHLDVVEVGGTVDYRTVRPAGADTGFRGRYVLTDQPELPAPGRRTLLRVGSRTITALAAEHDRVWFDFHDLCDAWTAAADYLALAERYPRWVLSGVPPLAACGPDAAQRFVTLVDVLHDRRAELTLLSMASLADLVDVHPAPHDLARTASRLAMLDRGCLVADSPA